MTKTHIYRLCVAGMYIRSMHVLYADEQVKEQLLQVHFLQSPSGLVSCSAVQATLSGNSLLSEGLSSLSGWHGDRS